MIDYKTLTQLVIEVFNDNPDTTVDNVLPGVEKLAADHDIFPSKDACLQRNFDFHYYSQKRLTPIDQQNVNSII